MGLGDFLEAARGSPVMLPSVGVGRLPRGDPGSEMPWNVLETLRAGEAFPSSLDTAGL